MFAARLIKLEKAIASRPCEVARTMKRVRVIHDGESRPALLSCRCGQDHHVKLIVIGDEKSSSGC